MEPQAPAASERRPAPDGWARRSGRWSLGSCSATWWWTSRPPPPPGSAVPPDARRHARRGPERRAVARRLARRVHVGRASARPAHERRRRRRDSSRRKGARDPFWSPDGQWIGFFKGTSIWKVRSSGGEPQAVAPARRPSSGSWGPDGTLLYIDRARHVDRLGAGSGRHAEGRAGPAVRPPHASRVAGLGGQRRSISCTRRSAPAPAGARCTWLAPADGPDAPDRELGEVASNALVVGEPGLLHERRPPQGPAPRRAPPASSSASPSRWPMASPSTPTALARPTSRSRRRRRRGWPAAGRRSGPWPSSGRRRVCAR